ncbi:MAG TPA: GNAT family protein [Candidatus Norongarragalinales archaeon]|jgi:RimJ/RimL family protein N-acetyltransferase|nr:GNAT family protein [Candidatus Norongarragalinales archaeon]
MNTLIGKSIVLRPLRLSDASNSFKHVSRLRLLGFFPRLPKNYTLRLEKRLLREEIKSTRKKDNFVWAITPIDNREFLIGEIGIKIDDRNPVGELGFWITPELHRKGMGSEACRIAVNYAFQALRLHKIYAETTKDNKAARKLLEKLHFKLEGILKSQEKTSKGWRDIAYYGLVN